jgi:undecaprenyl-diphosphatase
MNHSVLQYLLDLVARLGSWSYVIIFAAAALECAAFAGLLVPGESLVLASGFFTHQGILRLDAVMAAAASGDLLPAPRSQGGVLRPVHRLCPGAGAVRRRHLPHALPVVPHLQHYGRAVLWTIGFVTLGYVLGASWQMAEKWIGRAGLIVAGLIALVALVAWLRRRRNQARAVSG